MATKLEAFTITRAAEGYLIHIEDEEGEALELLASFDQLDAISEDLEAVLNSDAEEALEANEGDEES